MILKKKIATLAVAATLLVSSLSVYAETQSESPTHDGQTVTCRLSCDFDLGGTDTAQASTSWSGRTAHKIGVYLFQCQNITDSYHTVDSTTGDTSASVRGAVIGVWKYKSDHRVYHMDGTKITSTISVCEMTDW
ncbi:hypothetical protein [Ruminiclostridium josui]|uniref:hypothetical protein n=1 Tax=Ruminiclostridium josui TaxID=1499 RepID=UPI000463A259|nr:hypothetical protein [Ruminiclostridium josui]